MFKKNELAQNPFIIAEVGQNHQGCFDTAIRYIEKFSFLGVSAIKFQTRSNKNLFSEEAYNKIYNSENAFAETYGQHREKLELDHKRLIELKKVCKKKGVYYMSTPFDEESLEILCESGVDILKVASFDIGNLPFINQIAKKKLPVVISTGGGNSEQILESLNLLKSKIDDVAVLHCVSEYPCDASRLGLNNIEKLAKKFPDLSVGLSDHFNGTLSGPIAYMMGARVFEKHVTINRSWKGTDHSFALELNGFQKFVRDILRVPQMMISKDPKEIGKEEVFKKLGKSIIAKKDIKVGEILSIENLSGKIFNEQIIPVRNSNVVLGCKTTVSFSKNEPITYDGIEEVCEN